MTPFQEVPWIQAVYDYLVATFWSEDYTGTKKKRIFPVENFDIVALRQSITPCYFITGGSYVVQDPEECEVFYTGEIMACQKRMPKREDNILSKSEKYQSVAALIDELVTYLMPFEFMRAMNKTYYTTGNISSFYVQSVTKERLYADREQGTIWLGKSAIYQCYLRGT